MERYDWSSLERNEIENHNRESWLAQFYNKDRIIGLLSIFARNERIDNVILIHRV